VNVQSKRMQVELQGYVPPDLLTALADTFKVEETRRADGTHCSYQFVVPDAEKAFQWSIDSYKRNENALQNFILKVR